MASFKIADLSSILSSEVFSYNFVSNEAQKPIAFAAILELQQTKFSRVFWSSNFFIRDGASSICWIALFCTAFCELGLVQRLEFFLELF
jgi:hypothetical protein